MAKAELEARVELIDKFKPLYDNDTRYFVITGGRGSSKSFHVADFLLKLTYEPNHVILFTRYTMISAQISIIPEFIDKIDRYEINEAFIVTRDEIVNKYTGSKIIFKGIKTSSGNQTAALKSIQGVTTLVVDEAEELIDEDVFDKIDLSIRSIDVQNRVILVLNPAVRTHWIYDRFYQRVNIAENFNGRNQDTTYIHTSYLDNLKNLPESFLNRANQMKAHDYELYVHIMLGSWLDTLTGRMYTNLQYYNDLPEGESVVVVDTADTGSDYLCAIAATVTNTGYYIKDVVYTKEPQEITESLVAQLIIRNKTNRAVIESNNGGRAFARNVNQILLDAGWRATSITTFHQTANKQSRILNNSSTISLNCYFCKDLNSKFMLDLKTYSREGKNEHDDAPDCLTLLVEHFRTQKEPAKWW